MAKIFKLFIDPVTGEETNEPKENSIVKYCFFHNGNILKYDDYASAKKNYDLLNPPKGGDNSPKGGGSGGNNGSNDSGFDMSPWDKKPWG